MSAEATALTASLLLSQARTLVARLDDTRVEVVAAAAAARAERAEAWSLQYHVDGVSALAIATSHAAGLAEAGLSEEQIAHLGVSHDTVLRTVRRRGPVSSPNGFDEAPR